MRCPNCSNPLIVIEFDEIETDYCIKCKGIWLDAGELESLLEDSSAKNDLLNSIKLQTESKEKILKCPICNSKMRKVSAGNTETILLDECPNNHGFWFDSGEILSVIILGSIDKNNKVIQILSDMYKNEIKIKVEE